MVDREAFRGLVGEALSHLYEPAHLRQCPLSRLLTDGRLMMWNGDGSMVLLLSPRDERPQAAPGTSFGAGGEGQ